ncbi:hypothetical protein MC885_008385 [Smutsia gigantea]|nr:hypothetical protein MC885_008385 [Smutsia gigantea]
MPGSSPLHPASPISSRPPEQRPHDSVPWWSSSLDPQAHEDPASRAAQVQTTNRSTPAGPRAEAVRTRALPLPGAARLQPPGCSAHGDVDAVQTGQSGARAAPRGV